MPYRIEYASTGRASCHGPQPCAGTKIEKGQLRLGVLTEIQGHTSMIWRHWGCTTDRVLAHVKNEVEGDAKELDGFEDLEPRDQASVTAAFELGRLREEDITPCLREKEEHWREREREKAEEAEADDAGETKPPKRKAPTKAAKDESDDDDDLKPPPEDLPAKRTRKKPVRYAPSPKKKRRVKAEDGDEGAEDDAEDDGSDEEDDYGDSDDESSDVFDEDDAEDDDDDDEFDDDE